jgi:membrane protein YdbS with pleckstrin-like domain
LLFTLMDLCVVSTSSLSFGVFPERSSSTPVGMVVLVVVVVVVVMVEPDTARRRTPPPPSAV